MAGGEIDYGPGIVTLIVYDNQVSFFVMEFVSQKSNTELNKNESLISLGSFCHNIKV